MQEHFNKQHQESLKTSYFAFSSSWKLRSLNHYKYRTTAWIETAVLFLVQESEEFALCKFCHMAALHV
eukprot:4138098-Ditylum_brightwellii.AAC.1